MSSFWPTMDAVSWARSKSLEMMEPMGSRLTTSETAATCSWPALLSIGPSA